MKLPKLSLQRLRIDPQGYDASGAYWGTGPDVFITTSADGQDEITVRARNAAEARTKIAAELARKPGETREASAPLGGNPPRKSRYEIDWQDPASGNCLRLRITHSRDYLRSGSDHVEIESIRPKRAPLPITETGYRSHFLPALELMNAGGPVTFVTAWLTQEARGKAWSKRETERAQGDLFQWAETQSEVGQQRVKRKPAAPKPGPARTTSRGRSPT